MRPVVETRWAGFHKRMKPQAGKGGSATRPYHVRVRW